MIHTYVKSFGLGFVAGMRSMVAPALLSRKLERTVPAKEPAKPIDYLAQPPTTIALSVLAGGELIADKLPNAPNRTIPLQFGGRIASGATCGAAVSQVEGQSVPVGALIGGLGAVVGTLVFFNLRRWLDHDLGLPDTVGALAEDALAITLGWSLVNRIEPVPQPDQDKILT